MKAFLVGLLFLLVVSVLAGLGFLLLPFLLVLGLVLRVILSIALVIFAIWLLGKFIIFLWKKWR